MGLSHSWLHLTLGANDRTSAYSFIKPSLHRLVDPRFRFTLNDTLQPEREHEQKLLVHVCLSAKTRYDVPQHAFRASPPSITHLNILVLFERGQYSSHG